MMPAGSHLWIPLAPEQDGAGRRRLRIVAGNSGTAADIQILYRSASGVSLDSQQITLAPAASAEIVPPAGSGVTLPFSAEIRASVPVSARLEVQGSQDSWSVESLSPSPVVGGVRLVQPHLELYGIFTSRLVVLNSSSSSQTVTLRVYSKEGAVIGSSVTRSLPAYGTFSETVESLLGTSVSTTPASGWFSLEVSSAEVMAEVLAVDPSKGAAAGSALEAPGQGPWSMPYFVEIAGYYTGLAATNAGNEAVNMTLIAYAEDGTEIDRSISRIGAGKSKTALISQWFTLPLSKPQGHMVISADGPLSLLSYFGTDDGASLAAIPIRPIN
jgi:hypothetical protein